jgi:hypothetical protein
MKKKVYALAGIILAIVACVLAVKKIGWYFSCDPIMIGPQTNLDVTPLYKANVDLKDVQNINDIIDVSKFGQNYSIEDTSENDMMLWMYDLPNDIELVVYYDTPISNFNSEFERSCEDYPKGTVKYGGTVGNRYCISEVQELRKGPDAFCTPYGGYEHKYESFVAFQKGNLTIEIREVTDSPSIVYKNQTIIDIANALKKQQ